MRSENAPVLIVAILFEYMYLGLGGGAWVFGVMCCGDDRDSSVVRPENVPGSKDPMELKERSLLGPMRWGAVDLAVWLQIYQCLEVRECIRLDRSDQVGVQVAGCGMCVLRAEHRCVKIAGTSAL